MAEQQNPEVSANSPKVRRLDTADELVSVEDQKVGRLTQWRAATKERNAQQGQKKAVHTPEIDRRLSQLRQQRKRKKAKRWAVALGAFLVATVLFVGIVFYSPLLAVRTITVQGAHLLSEDYVQQQLSDLDGVPLTRVSEQDVQNRLGENSILRGVTIESHPPHELVVRLQERVPVAVVEQDKKFYLVDSDGVQLGTVDSVEDAGVPLIGGGLDAIHKDSFGPITQVLASLPSSLISEVSETKADSSSTITLKMKDGSTVMWGTSSESELKAKVLISLREALSESGGVDTYDVSSPLHPTTK
ncbi:cell division protein FtsQ/DivIB [Rothia terrae]|uniref:cell division protein FtsQ/DivIB n=1 Tax=Rothia terrae TaxID=396015 RepID=UPI003810BAA3